MARPLFREGLHVPVEKKIGKRDNLGIPLPPSTCLVASEQEDRHSPRVECEQDAQVAPRGRNSFMF